jgi:N utilization substance protein A
MKLTLDQNKIQIINLFQTITGCSVLDCINEEGMLFFVVNEGQYGLAVGKNGVKIKNAEKVFKKNIHVIEYSSDAETFVKNLVPEAQEITINDDNVCIKLKQSDRAKVIGRQGRNIKIIKTFLSHLFNIEDVKIK